jgi:hypothetical protein
VSARRLSIYNFVWGLLKATKKVYLIAQKKNKDTYGYIYPTKFASSTHKHKKVFKTPNQPNEIKIISNKSMLSTSKVNRRQKFVWELLDGVFRHNPKF